MQFAPEDGAPDDPGGRGPAERGPAERGLAGRLGTAIRTHGPATFRAGARGAARAAWLLVRPVVRPIVWRTRGFVTGPLLAELQGLRETQAETRRALEAALERPAPAPVESPAPAPPAVPARHAGAAKRVVHQVHTAAVAGDAITNAMLLMRGLLRAEGYRSEIFAADPDPALGGEVLPIEALPTHEDYVLIVHFSIGHASFARLAALPAAKILHYHNVTPAAFFRNDPFLARAVTEGRRQLAAWRPRVVAATADSAYNAIELRALGYDVVLECPLLFDIDALRARAGMRTPGDADAPFTVLFVGRVLESKGQAELVDAFAAFRAGFGGPCRLVLVGRCGPLEWGYPAEILARVERHRLGDSVQLTGLVDDDTLHAWYGRADLYVSLSRHEGFGVPLVEAMAHGVPVIAWPAGAVAYTLDGAGVLLETDDPAAAGAVMLALARDPARRAAIAGRQLAALDRFRLDRALPALRTALRLAGAAPPPDPAERRQLAANLRLTVAGHFNGSYSLAAVNRRMVAALEAVMPGRVGMQVYEAGQPAPFEPEPGAAGEAQAAIADRPPPATGPEIVICQHYPVLRPARPGDLTLGMQFWEESLVPAALITALARYRGVLAPAASVARALIDSGLPVPVRTVGFVPDLAAHAAIGAARLAAPARAPELVTFLHVSSAFPRKGIDALLAGWARAFRAGDAVRLVIKVFPNPHNDAAAQVAAMRAADPGCAEIVLIDRDIDQAAMLALFRDADAMVLPSRGEGFNMPAAEAVAAGLPVIVTGWGGHMDYLDAGAARLVGFTPARSRSHLASPQSQWAEPDVDDLTAALREVAAALRADPAGQQARAASARAGLLACMDPVAWAARIRAAALDLLLLPPARPLRVAWVSTWMLACGVGEHSRLLLDHVVGNPAFAGEGPLVLCDERPRSPVASPAAGLRVLPCWTLGGGDGGAARIARAVTAEDADAVVIQHQPMLLDWPVLAALLRDRALAGRVVVVALHNTTELETLPQAVLQATLAALAGADRLIVHAQADVTRMQRFGLLDRVTLLPVGGWEARPARRPRALPAEAAPVLGCFGFFLPPKGIGRLLQAAALLRADWPALRVRLVNARYPIESSDREIAACRALAERLGLDDAVDWHTEYLPTERALDLLGGCDLLVLPYEPSRESASSAVRLAMASGVAVAVTPVAIFDDQGEAVARLPGGAPEEIAAGVAALLHDPAGRARLQGAAAAWLDSVSWRTMSRRLQGMIQGLVESRRAGGSRGAAPLARS